ncbi:coth protein-domain-containing protein [Zychaea mexicana]|uniref:coth protein-domain-containing protein n=1 Tax=Zychaea mexicana TaxID=64656 RepID=UPI0022FDF5F4|nr:coth protein-domain-containing protein [Zychaea mexicana]KAI9491602.1 coth protein-domain-containing protein [Zychaea mexicana]
MIYHQLALLLISTLLLSTSFIAVVVRAAAVEFRVVAPSATDVQVSINGQNTKLTAQDPDVPYFVGQAEAGDGAKYKYIVGGTAEAFERTLEAGRTSTRNDFFNRQVTYANIPKLPWPIKENPQWTRAGPESPMFDTNYIPSIFMTMSPEEKSTLVQTVPADLFSSKFTFVGPDEVLAYENCSFGIHGAGKKHNNDKQSWRWMLPEGKYIYNRNYIKLRHMEEDPTQMREKTYSDILQAMGVYGNDANIVRFFINGEFFGTFNMLDDITQYSYINAVFYNGKPPQQMGPLYDGASGADFAYDSTGEGYSFWIPNVDSPEDYDAIDPLCQTLNQTDATNNDQISKLGSQFEIDGFVRFMVMEYLAGHWDGYWMAQTNDGAYRDPTQNNKWYYLGQDYDATFGVNLGEPEGAAFVDVSYKEFPQRYPGAVMINTLLENQDVRTKFETYLKDTVAVLFNNVTLTNRLMKYHEFLLPDLEWDRTVKQQSPGIHFGWSFEQVSQNLWEPVTASGEGGGADWGFLDWIVKKSQAVAKEFDVQITTEPVGPPDSASSASSSADTPAPTGVHPAGQNASAATRSVSALSGSIISALTAMSLYLILVRTSLITIARQLSIDLAYINCFFHCCFPPFLHTEFLNICSTQ